MVIKEETESIRPELIHQVQEKYKVGACFAEAYLSYWQRSRMKTYTTIQDILSSPDPEPMWFEYAMSTNLRGRDIQTYLKPHTPSDAKRYLDVGCGFGGYPCAFACEGLEVLGIEIDPVRIELSRANCRDHGIEDCIFPLSILEEDLAARLGRFDIITCMDVIEHVLDVPKALKNLANLLNPGGTLFLEIPNMDDLSHVASDGHFNLFGITQLDREEAVEYHRSFFSFEYDVGYYHPLDFYKRFLEDQGLVCEKIPSPYGHAKTLTTLLYLLGRLVQGYIRYLFKNLPKLSFRQNILIHRRLARYKIALLLNGAKQLLRQRETGSFHERYMTGFWILKAKSEKSTFQKSS